MCRRARPPTGREDRAALADFKQLAAIRFVEALPRAALEKVAKAQLRAQLAAEA